MNFMRHTKPRGARKAPPATAARVGRPPAGDAGEKVSEYSQLGIRVPPNTKALLEAIGGMTGMPLWKVMEEALNAYVRELPQDEQKVLKAIQTRRARDER